MAFDVGGIEKRLRPLFPVTSEAFEVALDADAAGEGDPPLGLDDDGNLCATLVLTQLEPGGVFRDLTVQRVVLAGAAHADDPRVASYLVAWARALPRLVARIPARAAARPSDLVYTEALSAGELSTEADFTRLFTDRDDLLETWASAWAETELLEEIAACGVGEYAPALRALEQHAIRVSTRPLEENATLPIGASRLGGLPDLPAGTEWPAVNGEPLDFIGQVDLDEIREAHLDPSGRLPPTGLLSFFFALGAEGASDPSDAEWRGGGRVLHFPDRQGLTRAERPAALEPHRVLTPRAVELEAVTQSPPLESPYYPALLGVTGYLPALQRAGEVFGEYASVFGPPSLDEDRPRQHLLGYGDPLQASPNVDCEGYSSGRAPEAWGEDETFWAAASRWQLLFQADSEPEDSVLLGDGGLLYFMIRPDDLAAHRFERTWTDWQSH